MTDEMRTGLDRRVDEALRQWTTPPPDPAFRARVLARLEEPASPWWVWTPLVRRTAVPVAAVTVVVALVFFIRVVPEPGAPRQQASTRAVTETPAGGGSADAPASAPAANAPAGSLTPMEGSGSAPEEGRRSLAVTRTLTRHGSNRMTIAAAILPDDSAIPASIPPVGVEEVAVEPIEVRPLATAARLSALDEPQGVVVEPISVEPLGTR